MAELKKGSVGLEVSNLQKALAQRGFDVGIPDAVFGPRTEAAVIALQRVLDLVPDGVAGLKTLMALGLIAKPKPDALSGLVEGSREWYRVAYDLCEIDPVFKSLVAQDGALVLKGMSRYQAVTAKRKMPWYVLGGLHFREASCNFLGIAHNGQKGLIGTDAVRANRKSTIEPKGVGPFRTWEASAEDALVRQPIGKVANWEIGNLLFHVERYNGSGYIKRPDTSPYLWGRTSLNDGRGLYTSDGRFDPLAPSNKTSGFCALLKWLEHNGHIQIERLVTLRGV